MPYKLAIDSDWCTVPTFKTLKEYATINLKTTIDAINYNDWIALQFDFI